MKKIELLSPAGSEDALKAAVMSGADAVYIGGDKFSARAGAKNFSDIKDAVNYCHKYGVKVYMAVNTLIKEKELDELHKYVLYLNECGADGVIIQDMGAAVVFEAVAPGIERHVSTQATAVDIFDVEAFYKRGFSRVVLARELSEKEIRFIRDNTAAELEMFVHGAICMCYSGQCLMSSVIGGRSGNRGRCAQPCRQMYRVTENGKFVAEGYILSPKDMAMAGDIPKLLEIGVDSLKIEGRLKRGEYVAAVTGVYRRCIDEKRKASEKDWKELRDAFSRSGFTNGYFTGRLGKDMMSHNNPSNSAENTFTHEAEERTRGVGKTIEVHMELIMYVDSEPVLKMWDSSGNFVEVRAGEKAQEAINRPLDTQRAEAQLRKLGATGYSAGNVSVNTDGKSTVPISVLNSLRRSAVELMNRERIKMPQRRTGRINLYGAAKRGKRNPKLAADVMSEEQARAAAEAGVFRIYADGRLAGRLREKYKNIEIIEKIMPDAKPETVLDRVEISTCGGIEKYSGKIIYGGTRLNITNSVAAKFYSELEEISVSQELNIKEIRQMLEHFDGNAGITVYGRAEVMLMKNCPLKAIGKCQKHTRRYALSDKMNEEFPVVCRDNCAPVLLNSKPVYMADKPDELLSINADIWRMVFTLESSMETAKIIEAYKTAVSGNKAESMKANTFTRGHFMRGVL